MVKEDGSGRGLSSPARETSARARSTAGRTGDKVAASGQSCSGRVDALTAPAGREVDRVERGQLRAGVVEAESRVEDSHCDQQAGVVTHRDLPPPACSAEGWHAEKLCAL